MPRPNRTWLTTPVALALILVCVTVSAAGAATVDPLAGAREAWKRLVTETKQLKRADADPAVRRSLVELAVAARSGAVKDPCEASKDVAAFRRALRKVSDDAKRAQAPAPASPQGTLRTDAFAVVAALKQLPGARRCGGGPAPAGETLETGTSGSGTQGVTLSLTMPRAHWTSRSGGGRDFTAIDMGGAESVGKVGEPGLPAFTELVALPQGANVSATVAKVDSYTLNGVVPFPKQQEAVDAGEIAGVPASTFADPPFKIDQKSYEGRAPIPAKPTQAVTMGTMRDLGVAAIQVAGATYSPRERKLEVVTRVEIKVTFGGGNTGVWRKRERTSVFERSFSRLYDATLANYDAVTKQTRQDEAEQGDETVLPCGEDMLIVTSPALRPAADTLAEARRAAGLVVSVRETGTGEGQIGTLNTQIRDFIRGEINSGSCTRPTYVILLGDAGQVPTFSQLPCTTNCPPELAPVATDLDYSLDGVGVDPFADVLLGRLPATDLAAAQTLVGKIIGYETTLPAPAGDDFYNHATVTSNFDGLGPVDGRTFTKASETVRAGLRSRGHVVDRLYSAVAPADIQQFKDGTPMPEEIKRPAEPWTAGRSELVNAFNDGRFFFMHRDHGSRFGWANPGMTVSDIPQLTNGTQLPVVMGVNCASGGFQFAGSPGFAQQMLQHPGGGAVGYFGDTENSPTNENTRLAIGWSDALFPDTVPGTGPTEPLTHMGEVLVAGKMAMGNGAPIASQLEGNVYKEHLIWHYLGDPSMQMWSATPAAFENVQTLYDARTGAFPIDAPAFSVQVTIGQPGTDGTIATLRNDGEAIGRAIVENGVAVISPERRTDSSGLTVSLERDGFITNQFPVSAPSPTHTINCPPTIDSEFGVLARGQVLSSSGVPLKDGVVNLRFTTPSRTFTRSVVTDTQGRWFRQEPVGSDHGPWKIEAFFNDKGVKDAVCQFVVP
jgi:hypothetical protein